MRICIVGAGAAGLASARQATDTKYNHSCTIFEQTGQIGGTWVYTDKTGVDEFGIPIHTSMYKNLRTNLPKEIMGYPGFPIPDHEESYITQEQILEFLNSYADHYNLRTLIKFYYRIKYIEPSDNIWKVTVTDLKKQEDTTFDFDAVMICVGNFHTPSIPKIPGSDIFKGTQLHSHDYRDIDVFLGKKLLVIGAGPSGLDIALQTAATAEEVYLSHHSKDPIKTVFPRNFSHKPDVISMTTNEVLFADGSKETVDVIIYCTGYQYYYPFLDEKSGTKVENNHVKPLYKQLININYPTMCFVGLPFYVCAFSMFDLQARFFLEHLKGEFKLPPKEEMLEELNEDIKQLLADGYLEKHAHMMGSKQEKYYDTLASVANITPLPPVMAKLHCETTSRFLDDLVNFRSEVYKIVDDYTFFRVK